MRWLGLYLRGRQVPLGAAVALVAVAALGLLARVDDSAVVRIQLTLFAVTVAVAATATGLAGADPALERTAAIGWPLRRLAHLTAMAAATAGVTALALPGIEPEVLFRNVAGLTGLAALGATLLGGGLAWCLPMLWTVVAVTALLTEAAPGTAAITWLVQPAGSSAALVTASVHAGFGAMIYLCFGPRLQNAA